MWRFHEEERAERDSGFLEQAERSAGAGCAADQAYDPRNDSSRADREAAGDVVEVGTSRSVNGIAEANDEQSESRWMEDMQPGAQVSG